MKTIILSLITALFTHAVFANGGGLSLDKHKAYSTREKNLERQEKIRQEMRENPRNRGMVESFEGVQERQEANEAKEIKRP